jgi:hypothetical protein
MNREELREIFDLAAKRDEKLYGWLRHLILLGSGSLTVLVSLQPVQPPGGLAGACLKCAWVSLGLGILLASVRLYGEVWTAKELVKRLRTMRIEKPAIDGISQNEPISLKPPWYILKAESACYTSFLLSVVFLVISAVMKS